MKDSFTVRGKVWKYNGVSPWHFVYVSDTQSAKLRKHYTGKKVAWGYIPIVATIRKTSWNTTLFPSKEGPYLLAIKSLVRKKEEVYDGDLISIKCQFYQ